MIRDAMSALVIGVACLTIGEVSGQTANELPLLDSTDPDLIDSASDWSLTNVVELLSGNQYSVRQKAMREVWRNRPETRDAVRRAVQNSDPEVAERAKWVLSQWQRGIFHDSPPGRHLGAKNPMAHLLDEGQFDGVLVAIDAAEGTQASSVAKKQVAALLTARFPFYVRTALKHQQVGKLISMIDLVADTKEMALCRVQLLQLQGEDFRTERLLPKAAEDWAQEKRAQTQVTLLMHLGRVQEAMDLAHQQADSSLLNRCQMLASRWSELARHAFAQAEDAEPGSHNSVQLWSRVLIASERSGIERLKSAAITKLSAVTDEETDKTQSLRWKVLASHGQLDAAFAIADPLSPDASASVALAASRPEHAFQVLGYPLELVDVKLDAWVDQALTAQFENGKQRLQPGFDRVAPEFRRMLALIRCLVSIGRDDAAWSIAERLCRSRKDSNALVQVREYVLSAITMTNRREWIVPLALTGDVDRLSVRSKSIIVRSLGNCDGNAFDLLFDAVGNLEEDADFGRQVSIVCQMFRGETPRDFDVRRGLTLLLDDLMRQLQEQPKPTTATRLNMNLAQLFAIHGESALASKYLHAFARRGEVNAMLELAEWEMTGGRMQNAAQWFDGIEQVARRNRFHDGKQPKSGEPATFDVDVAAVKALVGRWGIARRLDDKERIAALRKELDHVLCSPSFGFRMALADYLRGQGESSLAKQAFEVLLPMAVLEGPSGLDLYELARKYVQLTQEENPLEAARWFDLAVNRILESAFYRPSAYITLPLLIQHWKLDGAIRVKGRLAVEKSLQRILQLDPIDITFSEKLLPKMREAGMETLADATLDGIVDVGLEYVDRFSLDAMTCNNVAWVAAKNGKRLEDALRLANRAVTMKPDSATYRDTLAEVLFLLGRTQEALHIEQACLLDDPDQWHLHEQIEKYRDALGKGDS